MLLLASVGTAAKEGVPYLWPLDRTPDLSSSFGEYRSGRFHMGVDLSTNGEIGVPVHAAADGYVSRVRCSPWGYGRAVYVRFNDGFTAVYGHLSGFREDLCGYVRAEQHKRGAYTVEMEPMADSFPVRRGEVIAFTGDTGIGPAHLHFELRDPAGRPVSPCLLGMTWPDTEPPVFKSVLVTPRDPLSRVEGDVLPLVRKAERSKEGCWTCAPVRVRGGFAVAVDLVDPTPAGNKLGVHQAKLIGPDGGTVFEVRHDTIAYDEHGAAFAYHPCFGDEGHFLLLWRWPGNAAASDAVSPGDGWCNAPLEKGLYHIELTDFMGNAATLELPITPDTGVEKEGVSRPSENGPDRVDGELKLEMSGTFLTVTATFPTPEAREPELVVDGRPAAESPFFPAGKHTFRAAWQSVAPGGQVAIGAKHPRLASEPIMVETVASGAARSIQWDNGPRLDIPAGAACGPLFLRAGSPTGVPAASVPAYGPAWRIWPDTAPLAAAAEVMLPMPEGVRNPAHAAIARRGVGGWSWMKTTRRGGMLAARTDRLGDFRVIEDDQAPRELEFAPGATTPITSARPHIHASVSDAGSGIAAWDLRCDGAWLLSAFDPETGRVDWERDEDLAPGTHEITLTLTDDAGNTSSKKHTIIIPKK